MRRRGCDRRREHPDELDNLIDRPEVARVKADLQHQLEAWERQYPHRA
jgi:hypothetical protein